MAEWISGVKEVVTTFFCGRITPPSASSVTLEGCAELGVVSSDHPLISSTMIDFSLDDSCSDTSSSSMDLEDGSPSPRPRGDRGNTALNSKSSSQRQVRVHCKGCPDVPVRTKTAQGVFLEGQLYVGGGYVDDSKLSAVIHKFDPLFELWDSLPVCPVKLFGMSLFNQQLILVGGREVGRLGSRSSNKLFTWDKESRSWNNSIPPMTFARTSPVVINYDRFLIVAGGNKGSLDYNMEVYDRKSQRWTSAPPLPMKCFPPTSAVTGRSWFLLNPEDATIVCADLPTLLEQVTGAGDTTTDKGALSEDDSKTQLWTLLPKPPCEPTQVTTVGGKLLALAHQTNPVKVSSFLFNSEAGSWSYSYKLPNLCGHSSALPDSKDGTYLFGGEGGAKQYSNKLYKLTLRESSATHDHQTKNMKPPITFCL